MSGHTTGADADRDAAVVAVTLAASPARAFAALTRPALVREWFGSLSAPLETGATARLDFGDGDFFVIDDVKASPPTELAYRWSFLGTSAADLITWRIEPVDQGALVTVRDWNGERDPTSNQVLEEGWRDFTDRLAEFLATGRNTRYDWRRTFEGAIELPITVNAARRLLSDEASRWLPLSAGGLQPGETLRLQDDSDDATCAVEDVFISDTPPTVRVLLSNPAWRRPTASTIALRPRGHHTILSVTHEGWARAAADPAAQKRYRQRFAAMWIAALHRATTLFPARQAIQQSGRGTAR